MAVWVYSVYAGFLPHPKDMQIRATGYSELPIGANVPSPVIDWRFVQGVSHFLTIISWHQLGSSLQPLVDKRYR